MGNFQGGNNRGGGFRGGNGGGGFRGGNGGGGFRGGDRGPVTMHKAICDECHKECEVPFRPSGDKPIFCSECFSSKRGNEDRGPRKDFGNDRAPKRDFNDRPAQPSFVKSVTPVQNDNGKQLAEINTKLDRLVIAIERLTQPKKEIVKTPVVKAIVKKEVKTPVKKVVTKKKK
jgi:CxxC-x17-CxxC domain-containing protein